MLWLQKRDIGLTYENGEEKEWLGEGGEGAFEFNQMQEIGTSVAVVGANVLSGKEVGSADGWWEWIGEQL